MGRRVLVAKLPGLQPIPGKRFHFTAFEGVGTVLGLLAWIMMHNKASVLKVSVLRCVSLSHKQAPP